MSATGRRDVRKSSKRKGRRAGRIGFLALAVAAAWALVAAVAIGVIFLFLVIFGALNTFDTGRLD